MMHPFIGSRFGAPHENSVLLVGESHYLPLGSTVHLDAAKWYQSSDAALGPEEKDWISTAEIYDEAKASNFSNKAHSIWGNSLWVLNDAGPKYEDYRTAADHVAAYNFFFRPAIEGDSLAVENIDIEVACRGIQYFIEHLRPTSVIFLSRKAFDCLDKELPLPCTCTPHPGCAWWNRPSDKYGGRTGSEVLRGFVKSLSWPAPQK